MRQRTRCQERGEGGSFFGTAVASIQMAAEHVVHTEIAEFTEDDMLRSSIRSPSPSLFKNREGKKNPLHPAAKFISSFGFGASIGFKKTKIAGYIENQESGAFQKTCAAERERYLIRST
jgi:hypothetical protein